MIFLMIQFHRALGHFKFTHWQISCSHTHISTKTKIGNVQISYFYCLDVSPSQPEVFHKKQSDNFLANHISFRQYSRSVGWYWETVWLPVLVHQLGSLYRVQVLWSGTSNRQNWRSCTCTHFCNRKSQCSPVQKCPSEDSWFVLPSSCLFWILPILYLFRLEPFCDKYSDHFQPAPSC